MLRLKIMRATTARLAWCSETRINRQFLKRCQMEQAAVTTCPGRKGHTQETLARDAPVPLQMLNPILVARTHVLRLPAYLASRCQKLLLLIKDTNKPWR